MNLFVSTFWMQFTQLNQNIILVDLLNLVQQVYE